MLARAFVPRRLWYNGHMKENVLPSFVKSKDFSVTSEYRHWLSDVKDRLRRKQIKAAMRVNAEFLEFYWELGRDIVDLKAVQAWGSGVIQQLSLDLRDEFPKMTGLSYTNLKYASQWYRFYTEVDDSAIRHQLGGELGMPQKFALVPWRHHVEIIAKSRTVQEAFFYIDKVIEGNWSRSELQDRMAGKLYERQGKALTNFGDRLPHVQGSLATEILKDPYHFDFLSMREGYDERMLEDALEHNIRKFLLELGTGFAYVGRQMELKMPGGKTYFPDMVFYHTKLKCYVVLELKVVDFEPEFVGKLNFYVSAADALLKDEGDNPSIGLLVCKSKDETVVQWAFAGLQRPIGVATYELNEVLRKTLAEKLPTIEQIENAIE